MGTAAKMDRSNHSLIALAMGSLLLAVLPVDLHLNRYPGNQRLVKSTVALDQRGMIGLGDLVRYLFEGGFRNGGVEAMQRGAELIGQQHFAVVAALGRVAVGGDIGTMEVIPAGVLEPSDGELFEMIFGNHFICI